ncbi:MAG: hypothetical protein WB784_11105 [Rhodanobacteraceae bacterium]
MPITVTLNTSLKPPVMVTPSPFEVTKKGLSEIAWAPAKGQTFKFESLTFADNPGVFSGKKVTDGAISINDNNETVGGEINYPYTIVVSLDGVNYSSATAEPGGDGSAPVIRNR